MKQAIIVVDDEILILQALKLALQVIFKDSMILEFCESGEEAWVVLNDLIKSGIDVPVIVTDYVMPGMKGDELLEIIHNDYPEILSVMLTGQATFEGVQNAINKANLFIFMTKPWELNQFELSVKKAITLYNTQKELKLKQKAIEEAYIKLKELDASKNKLFKLLNMQIQAPFIQQEFMKMKKIADIAHLLSQLKSEKYRFGLKSISIGEFLKSSLDAKNSLIVKKNIKLNYSDELFNLNISADPDLMGFVFISIIDNAVKFSPDGGELTIDFIINSGMIDLSIADQGSGFSGIQLANLLKFFSSEAMDEKQNVVGLSLAAAKVIMDAQGFKMSLSNNEANGGALVNLKFSLEENN